MKICHDCLAEYLLYPENDDCQIGDHFIMVVPADCEAYIHLEGEDDTRAV